MSNETDKEPCGDKSRCRSREKDSPFLINVSYGAIDEYFMYCIIDGMFDKLQKGQIAKRR